MRLYLCGEIGGGRKWEDELADIIFCRKVFEDNQLLLEEAGYEVWNPLKEVPNPQSRKEAIQKDLEGVFLCDGIAVIENKDCFYSPGVEAEKAVAHSIGLPVRTVNIWLLIASEKSKKIT
jgi:hypothetical protein